MNSETRTTVTLFAIGFFAILLVFSGNLRFDDIIRFFAG
ncbi:MAG: Hypothetical protein BHV28_10120 [Candidatus Tokpelaia hoelldobleri]|uniref:Uncharacterized protein n=1 Tax=Candidatus Tokpelaia hoelldobleri TaxID=1902579 RepID=A0A1U9JV33_9HYPH|nr:MAG: Hypothetical protein BHV28_10120 [Candidatus Tokpelaia hoelldoblerii]